MGNALLRIENLTLHFRTTKGVVQAVDEVSFNVDRNQALVILGESGCGKTSLSRAILRLLPRNVQKYTGKVWLNDTELMALDDETYRKDIRWVKMSMVPQAAMNSLNPVIRVGEQVAEPMIAHYSVKKEALEQARKVFRTVGVPEDFMSRYAFELSGGMRQRVAIAMSLVTSPDLVLLDEPTSALDVLTQANIMNTLKQIRAGTETSFILITHDIATSSELATHVAIMYAGQIVEYGDAAHFFTAPLHPYSQKLMASVPTLRQTKNLEFIPGRPPSLISLPTGCRFAARCPARFGKCEQDPPTTILDDGRRVKCWLHVK